MLKMIHLVQNEMIKQLKKVSVIIMLCILLLASIALPVLMLVWDKLNTDGWELRYSQKQIEWLNDTKENPWGEAELTDQQKAVFNEAIDIEIQYYQMIQDYRIDWDDWRSDEINTLENAHELAFVEKQLLNGWSSKELIEISEAGPWFIQDNLNQCLEMTDEELQQDYDENMARVSSIYQSVVNNDYLGHLVKDVRPGAAQAVSEAEQAVKDLLPSASEEEKRETQANLEAAKLFLEVVDYRLEHKVLYDTSDWRHNTLLGMYSQVWSAYDTEILTQEEYQARGATISYDEYKKMQEDTIQEAKDEIARCRYSLEHNIPIMDYARGSRSLLAMGLLLIMGVMIICIMIGGGIMSQEYSKGTVRLLMLRPVSRWKIILSKFICVLLIGLGATVASSVVQTIMDGALFGFSDLMQPVLMCSGGVVSEVPFALWYLAAVLFAWINVLFASCLAVTLSTVFRNTAFAVGLSIFITLSGFFVVVFSAQLGLSWMAYTIFPYFDLGTYVTNGVILELYQDLSFRTYPAFGAVLLSALAVVLAAVTTVIFQKRDVKN